MKPSKQAKAPEATEPEAPEPTFPSAEEPRPKGNKAPPAEQKTSRAYRVSGPGSICLGGRFYGPGEEIVLSRADAQAFNDRIKPADR